MKKNFTIASLLVLSLFCQAQITPEITSWILNTTGATGYNSIPSNVQVVQYSTNNVYVSCTCIPGYDIGPWPGNPNTPVNENFVYKITRHPVKNTGTLTPVGLGHIGVWSNGVSIFNADDGQTYNNQGVWHRNAYFFEGSSFDSCLGHPAPNGEYHNHVNPICLYDDHDTVNHSPIIGYMFDGFPIYGAYGYNDTLGNGPIRKMRTSYRVRNITMRDTLPDGSAAAYPGPAVSVTYPLGAFIQDYMYVPGSGDLDMHNGRVCVTPDYPLGIYAYFVTIDSALTPIYPYTAGPTYCGTVQAGNTGPGSGHNTISETTIIYTGTTGIAETQKPIKYQLLQNPTSDYAYVYFAPSSANNIKGNLYNCNGQLLESFLNLQPSSTYSFDFTKSPAGIYFLQLETEGQREMVKIVKVE